MGHVLLLEVMSLSALPVIDGFAYPRLVSAYDVDKINRAVAKGKMLFSKEPPHVQELLNRRGEPYLAVSNTDYKAVRHREAWECDGRTIIQVCRNPATWEAYRAACKIAGEEPRIEVYLVDIDAQSCTCEAWQETQSYCKHLLGLAYWLRLPHRISPKGVIHWCEGG